MTPLPGADALVLHRGVADAYAGWLADQADGPAFDGYYTEPRARFACHDDDVLHAPADAESSAARCGARVSSVSARASLDVCGVRAVDVARLLRAIDGARTAREVRALAAVTDATWTTFLDAAFGTVVFAPMAIAELEACAPSAELVRFPGSPYEVVRAYWANQVDVRLRVHDPAGGLGEALASGATFLRFLRELHALALTGASGASFYRPASPAAVRERLGPGDLAVAPIVTEETAAGLRFVSGLRVAATDLGGPFYGALLAGAAPPDAAGLGDELPWGGVVTARADGDERAAPWFCPPRPLRAAHFDALAARLSRALLAARTGDGATALAGAAAFHHGFVRLHPFAFANQCLAMALVNHVLTKAGGAGIPHLVLDHLALQLPLPAYAGVFRRAVVAWRPEETHPVQRTLAFVQKKARCFDFMRALARAPSMEAATELVGARPGDARLALL